MRQPLVAGNWKMNGSAESIRQLLDGFVFLVKSTVEVVVFPPAIYIQQVSETLRKTAVKWGLQNISSKDSGAFTGELSPLMAKDFGCKYVIVGHSERRSIFGESNQDVAAKFHNLLGHGVTPILCVGESLKEREAGDTMNIVAEQLECALSNDGTGRLQNFVIAYEPVWAIGTGLSATPEQAQDVHLNIRKMLSQNSEELAQRTRILYGGSMNSISAAGLMAQRDVDGGLIGGASLVAEDFKAICHATR